MDFSKFTFSKKYIRNFQEFHLNFDFGLSEVTGHNRKIFDDYRSLLYFLGNNPNKAIYLTLTQTDNFSEEDDKLVINLRSYQAFCNEIGRNGKERTQAFLTQKLGHYSEDVKKEIIAGADELAIIERVKNFSEEQKNAFLEKLKSIEGIELPKQDIKNLSNEDFLKAFSSLLNDPSKQQLVVNNYSQIQVKILEEYKNFLEGHLDKDETFIQNWIDGKIDNGGNNTNLGNEEVKRIKKSRCLIFGLEFISHKREGRISSKRFDILTRISQGKNDYVLIELKSPNSDVFKIVEVENGNDGKLTEYHLSADISRAIPQISDYRSLLENATDVEWQGIGLPKGKISKCIIIIGTKKEDPVWAGHFSNLRRNLSNTIEILTYTDLVLKLETTISNLNENL